MAKDDDDKIATKPDAKPDALPPLRDGVAAPDPLADRPEIHAPMPPGMTVPPLARPGADRRAPPDMKLWVVRPRDMAEPPFHYSNTPNIMLIAAESADIARRMASTSGRNDLVWMDEDRVICEEFTPMDRAVLTTDFWG